MLSPRLAENMPDTGNLYYVPNGVRQDMDVLGDPAPFNNGNHAVSVGSMLFDPVCIEIASKAFPEITFHVIGSGRPRLPGYGDNVQVYGDMEYQRTLRYIKHAAFGLAPYVAEEVPAYLADSSMKLLQYDYYGTPAVCPYAVVGDYPARFGYIPGDPDSIVAAIKAALHAPHRRTRQCLDWSQVADRLITPEKFADTLL
jgi:2-beta-glucuronyltransferase